MRVRRIMVCALACALISGLGMASYYIPPAPLGWEERVTPGYDPSVESVVIRMSHIELQDRESLESIWAGWDEGAVDVLLKLHEESRWREFRGYIIRLLTVSPAPRAGEWIETTLKALMRREDLSEDERLTFQRLLYSYPQARPKQNAEFVEYCLQEGNVESRQWAIGQLIAQRTESSFARALEAIQALPEERQREWLFRSVDEARGYLRAQEPMKGGQR